MNGYIKLDLILSLIGFLLICVIFYLRISDVLVKPVDRTPLGEEMR